MIARCKLKGSVLLPGLWRRAVIILLIGLWVKTVNAVTLVKEEPVSSTEFTATTPYNSSNTPADVDDLAITVNTTVPYSLSSTTIAPHPCAHGVMKIPPEEGISLHTVQGRYVVTIITSDPYSPQLVLERAKAFNQLEQNFDIGARILHIKTPVQVKMEDLLRWEWRYKELCLPHVLGFFIDHDYFANLETEIISEMGLNLWPLDSRRRALYSQIARVVYELPWEEQLSSVEILTQNALAYKEFLLAMRTEHICLAHFHSDRHLHFHLVEDPYPPDADNDSISDLSKINPNPNGNIFVVTSENLNHTYLSDLPEKTYIFQENEIILRHILEDNNPKMDEIGDKGILPSRVLTFAHSFLQLIHWLKSFLSTHCHEHKSELILPEECEPFLRTAIEAWRNPAYSAGIDYSTEDILQLLNLNDFRYQMSLKLLQKLNNDKEEKPYDLHEVASMNLITNVTTFYYYNLGNQSSIQLKSKFGQIFHCQFPSEDDKSNFPLLFNVNSAMYWRFKPDTWVVVGLTMAIVGLVCAGTILIFVAVRIALGDVFEGNPVGTILLLLSLMLMFSSIVPFCLEYIGEQPNSYETVRDIQILNSLCGVRIFLVTQLYCLIFALLLCRAIMLACIGTDGGFLSHVNGYLQAVIGILSVLVQLGMSLQLLIVMQVSPNGIFCDDLYYGYSLFGLLSYDLLLLVCLVGLIPFVYRSQRNYREGIMFVVTVILLFIIWLSWMSIAFFNINLRDIAIPLGLQASGWAVLLGILFPRTFLILRGIERSDLTQTLPSLTTLALAHNNQNFYSQQSVYECVNPAMRNSASDEVLQTQLASEMPTLPIRRNNNRYVDYQRNSYQVNGQLANGSPTSSLQISSPPLPSDDSKMTRF